MAGFAVMLEYTGATNNWSTYFRPIISCPGILPMILTLLWSRQTRLAALLGPALGLVSGVATWLSLSWKWGGTINIQTTQLQLPGLYGAIVSFFSPALYSVIISLVWPSRFDWREFLRIDLIEDNSEPSSSLQSKLPSSEAVNEALSTEKPPEKAKGAYLGDDSGPVPSPPPAQRNALVPLDDVAHPFDDETIRHIKKWFKIASIYFVVNVLVTIVLWPMPLYRNWIFTKSFFSGWVRSSRIALSRPSPLHNQKLQTREPVYCACCFQCSLKSHSAMWNCANLYNLRRSLWRLFGILAPCSVSSYTRYMTGDMRSRSRFVAWWRS